MDLTLPSDNEMTPARFQELWKAATAMTVKGIVAMANLVQVADRLQYEIPGASPTMLEKLRLIARGVLSPSLYGLSGVLVKRMLGLSIEQQESIVAGEAVDVVKFPVELDDRGRPATYRCPLAGLGPLVDQIFDGGHLRTIAEQVRWLNAQRRELPRQDDGDVLKFESLEVAPDRKMAIVKFKDGTRGEIPLRSLKALLK